jgi:thioredoxin-like negative regulator of GroEL
MTSVTAERPPRLVFFTDETSGQCRRVEGWVAQVLQHRRNHLKIKLVMVERAARPDLVDRFQVEQFPTLVVVEEHVAGARISCPRGIKEIEELLERWLGIRPRRSRTRTKGEKQCA